MKTKMAALCSCVGAFALAAHAGGRVASKTRTVTGAFTTVFRPDDGTTTTLSTPPPFHQSVPALLVPDDSPSGYTVFPVTLGPDNTFTVPDVPNGPHFVQLDRTYMYFIGVPTLVSGTELIELTADTPDLSLMSAARPDLERVTMRTPVTLNVLNLQPWQSGNQFLISSSQADVDVRPSGLLAPGATQPTDFLQAATVFSFVPMSPAPTDPIAPVLGPPTAPLLNGVDAFVPQSGVGLQPTFSWSPPNLGTATSYQYTADCVTGIFIP